MNRTPQELAGRRSRVLTWMAAALLTAIVAATYWSAMAGLVQRWYGDPDYVHGFLVPVFAAVLLWRRREMLRGGGSDASGTGGPALTPCPSPLLPGTTGLSGTTGGRGEQVALTPGPSPVLPPTADRSVAPEHAAGAMWEQGNPWGLLLLAIAGAMRMVSSYYYYELLDPASLIPCLAGIALFAGGWKAIRWAWPAIVFLVFMIPLPGFLATRMGGPLQRLATIASTYLIQTVGISAVAEGNVISLSDSQIGVAEVCNGLRNMMLFLAVCVGLVFISRRSAVEKAIIVLSSAAIALLANVVRITATAILHQAVSHQAATTLYHDLAGWFMMPLAVVFLWLELAYLNHVFVRRTSGDEEPA